MSGWNDRVLAAMETLMPPLAGETALGWNHRVVNAMERLAAFLPTLVDANGHPLVSSVTIAAADSPAKMKAAADYVCTQAITGQTDDKIIRDAIATLPLITGQNGASSGRGRIRLCQGNYNIYAPVVMSQGLTIEGDGPWNTFLNQKADVSLLTCPAVVTFFMAVRNLGLEGRWLSPIGTWTVAHAGAGTECGINWGVYGADSLVENVWAQNFSDSGIRANTAWNMKVRGGKFEYNGISGISGFGDIEGAQGIYNTNGLTTIGNVNDGVGAVGARIVGCQFIRNRAYGVAVNNSNNNVIVGNTIGQNNWDSTGPGVNTTGESDDGGFRAQIDLWGSNNTVMDNEINCYRGRPGYEGWLGISDGGVNNIITNNNIHGYRSAGAAIRESGSGRGSYELTTDLYTVLAGTTDRVVASVLPVAGALTLAAQPDVPRTLTYTLTDANNSITAYVVTVVGIASTGGPATEVWTLAKGKTWTGAVAFEQITSITASGITGTVTDPGDAWKIGTTNVLGLSKLATNATAKTIFYCDRVRDILSVRKNGTVVASDNATMPLDVVNGTLNVGSITNADVFIIRYRAARNIEQAMP